MPNFLGIGAQKAATTWIYMHLRQHPQIAFPATKELHFWDRRDGRPPREWLNSFEGLPETACRGEITPAYACLDDASIRLVESCAPGLRIFYSLRNPIERAWSAALMAAGRAELEVEEASDAWFIDHFQSSGSMTRGDYEGCLQRWRAVFPPEQIRILFFDDIVDDPKQVLVEIAEHLGINPDFYERCDAESLRERVLAGPSLPVRETLLPQLHEIYDGRIDSLANVVDRDLSHWKSA